MSVRLRRSEQPVSKSNNPASTTSTDDFLTVPEAARLLRITPRRLNKLARSGQISCFQVIPRRRLFSREQIDEFLRRRELGGESGDDGEVGRPTTEICKISDSRCSEQTCILTTENQDFTQNGAGD